MKKLKRENWKYKQKIGKMVWIIEKGNEIQLCKLIIKSFQPDICGKIEEKKMSNCHLW